MCTHYVHMEDAVMSMASVGIREFRAGLAGYLASPEPVAVTKHGVTVGWFIPTPADREAEVASLRQAAARLDALLAEQAPSVDDLVREYDAARRSR